MVMYMCARGIAFASVYEFVDWILELFQQCGIFFFHSITLSYSNIERYSKISMLASFICFIYKNTIKQTCLTLLFYKGHNPL